MTGSVAGKWWVGCHWAGQLVPPAQKTLLPHYTLSNEVFLSPSSFCLSIESNSSNPTCQERPPQVNLLPTPFEIYKITFSFCLPIEPRELHKWETKFDQILQHLESRETLISAPWLRGLTPSWVRGVSDVPNPPH